MTDTLTVENLTVTYGADPRSTPALDSVSLHLPRGEVTAVVGESGSGKSTLAHSIVRLLPRTAEARGRVTLEGQDVLRIGRRELRSLRGRSIGFVPQDPVASLNPTRTVGAQLRETFTLAGRRVDEAQVLQDLADLGLPDPEALLERYPHELSGGMRQRILVAMAFSQRPELVVADEPTSALDALVARAVLERMESIRARHGTTVLLITHDLAVARRYAQHVHVLRRGTLVESGPVADVFAAPDRAYTRELLDSSVRIRGGEVVSIAEAYDAQVHRPLPTVVEGAEPAVRMDGVSKWFGSTLAVDDVSLTLPVGQTLAVVGESGSGKTTTGRMILGLERPSAGSVRVLGHEVGSLGRRELRDLRRQMQVVYQSPFESLSPRLTLAQVVAEPLAAHGEGGRRSRRRRAEELLELVQLPSTLADRRPAELSGGQRQRVAIARALALSPRLLVLDEPVSALDATVQSQVIALLGRLQRELDLTYFLVTHDLGVVTELADQVMVLRGGRVVEAGPVGDVVTTPADSYTRDLVTV
ncbi:nickel ABC transporter ATP-binding protein NikE [Georgenia sp. Z1491]|uniref:nickel ABC transporter ATP-binding protein NikE n=1 Tax=Georgenia sp. Z1491 TaxID=3416707 RepID=UPI003CF6AE56